MQSPSADLDEVQRSCALFMAPGDVIELRAPKSQHDGVISGYFSDPEKLARAAMALGAKTPGVYVTLNPVSPDLLARADNRSKPKSQVLTRDSEIVRRRWLLLDFDPGRPAGISSTDIEHEAALASARHARESLQSEGWPGPVLADSGNGGHLLYRIDLPNDAASATLVKSVLNGLAARFDTAAVTLDLSVFNASRISKLYGTVARKGDSTETRPHRLSRIIDLPEALEIVTGEQLQARAAGAKPATAAARSARTGQRDIPAFDLETWLARHGIQVAKGPLVHEGSEKWVLQACPFNPAHQAPDSAIFRRPSGALGFICLHASCSGKNWKEFREFYEPEFANRAFAGRGLQTSAMPPAVAAAGCPPASDREPDVTPDLLRYPHNDHGNAERLIALFGEDMRFCHPLKKWLLWDGKRWAVSDVARERHLAKLCMLEFNRQAIASGRADAEKFARASLEAKRIASMLTMAESEIFARPEDLDKDPFALNFINGTVDLRTSAIRPASRADLLTKLIHYRFDPLAPCDRWIAFLDQVMGGGPDASEGALERAARLTEYLQRAVGYSLTGSTSEKAVFVVCGSGNNGKSTMLSTIRDLAEEYSVLLQIDTLMVRQESNNTQSDLADLRGARFVQTSESEEGQRLAQGKLKRITQGMGKIKAVRKYENPIEFQETHKLWLDTNRKPIIRDADDVATFNRLHPIPFEVSISSDQIDKELPTKLLREAEGILAWIVAGARQWHLNGLAKPPEVESAKNEWRSQMDHLGRFVEENCVVGEGFRVSAAALYSDYRRWAETGGEHAVTSTAFGVKVSERFSKVKTERGAVYLGIGIAVRNDSLAASEPV